MQIASIVGWEMRIICFVDFFRIFFCFFGYVAISRLKSSAWHRRSLKWSHENFHWQTTVEIRFEIRTKNFKLDLATCPVLFLSFFLFSGSKFRHRLIWGACFPYPNWPIDFFCPPYTLLRWVRKARANWSEWKICCEKRNVMIMCN